MTANVEERLDRLIAALESAAAAMTRERPLTVKAEEAAAMLSISRESLEKYVLPDLKIVREGSLRLYPIAELERWVRENAARTL